MTEGQGYPFVLFGAEPSRWYDLIDDLFSYEICFVSAPDEDARQAVAEAWERGLDQRAVELVSPFLWTDRWALARVRPAGWSEASVKEMARAVQGALRKVHEACPIEEVVLAESRESGSAWDAWSAAKHGEPKVGPAWPIKLPRSEARFPAACAEDPAFESARHEARAALAEEAREASLTASEGDGEGDDIDGSSGRSGEGVGGGARLVEGELKLVGLDAGAMPRAIEVEAEDEKLFGERTNVAVAPSGRVFGVAKLRRQPPQAAWIADGALGAADGGPLPNVYGASLTARDDSEAALLGFDRDSLWEVDFAEGIAVRLFKHKESLSDVAYGPDGRVLLLVESSLDVYVRGESGTSLEKRWAVNGYTLRSLRRGRVLFVTCYEGGDDGITVLGFDGSTLRRLARVNASVSELVVKDDRVFTEVHTDGDGEAYELAGWEAMLAKLDADPSAFPEVPEYVKEESEDADEGSSRSDEDDGGDSDDSGDDDDEPQDSDEDDDGYQDDEDEDEDESDDDDDDDDDKPRATRKKAGGYALQPSPGRVGLVYLGQRSPVKPRAATKISADIKTQFGGSSSVEASEDSSLFYGWKKDGRRSFRFAVLLDGKLLETDATSSSASTMMALRHDRKQVLTSSDDDSKLWSISLPSGKASLVWDFSKEEDESEVYSIEPLAFNRAIATTIEGMWIFSLAAGRPAVEARGHLDVQQAEVTLEGRVIIAELGDSRNPMHVWGVFEDGLRTLAELELRPSKIEVREGRALVQGTGGAGWYELVNIEDAWRAASRDTSGARYPRLALSAAPDEEEDEDEDDDED